eukprot:GGOE01013947.1.p1 GENE.GGOE01013947.1~~GGOE01013947.1.p1  ORF type:complete len:310 (+),score=9.17 GGOE01013947.1:121-930(+)
MATINTTLFIPIFVLTRDRLAAVHRSLQSYNSLLQTRHEVIICDHQSTYPPMKAYLKELEGNGTKVIQLTGDWFEALSQMKVVIKQYLLSHPTVEFYVVTDADIEFHHIPGDALIFYAGLLRACPTIEVVGPALSLSDIPDSYKHKKEVIAWELQFSSKVHFTVLWQGIPFNVVQAKIDTTFAIRRASAVFRRVRVGFRTMAPYHASHSDWYVDVDNPAPDHRWYLEHQHGVNHWGSTTPGHKKQEAGEHPKCLKKKCPRLGTRNERRS